MFGISRHAQTTPLAETPFTVTPFTVTLHLQRHFWPVLNDWFVTEH